MTSLVSKLSAICVRSNLIEAEDLPSPCVLRTQFYRSCQRPNNRYSNGSFYAMSCLFY